MVKISSKASRPGWQRAMAKATAHYAAGVRARHLGGRRNEVPSATSSAFYVVEVVNPGAVVATCTCPHGQRAGQDAHCYHAALAICAEVERVSRATRPQPAPKPVMPPAAGLDATMRALFPATAAP